MLQKSGLFGIMIPSYYKWCSETRNVCVNQKKNLFLTFLQCVASIPPVN